jgi:hypothetical protein
MPPHAGSKRVENDLAVWQDQVSGKRTIPYQPYAPSRSFNPPIIGADLISACLFFNLESDKPESRRGIILQQGTNLHTNFSHRGG